MRSLFVGLGRLANLCLGLACMALGLLGWIDGGDMHVPLLPVEPASAATWLVGAGVFAILAVVLARGSGRWSGVPVLFWSFAVVAVLLQAVFDGAYRFDGTEDFALHSLMALGATVMLWASWLGRRSAAQSRDSGAGVSRRSWRFR